MKLCISCSSSILTWTKIDGKKVNTSKRKLCLTCSPYKNHNTKKVEPGEKLTLFVCKCGETDRSKFPINRRTECRHCRLKYNLRSGQAKKDKARKYLGGRCMACGYNRWLSALDLHHLDPEKKDPNFKGLRGWTWERILKELSHCIVLCRNCHSAHHSGENVFLNR